MTEGLILGLGLGAGVDWRVIALLAAGVWVPLPAASALMVILIVARRSQRRADLGREVRFAESVAGELRAGSSLRAALRSACADLDGTTDIVRRLDVGDRVDRAIAGIAAHLPSIGQLVESAVSLSTQGGRLLPIFEELMVHAASQEAADSELRTALAPVRASLTVLVGAPLAYLVWSAATGRLTRLLSLPGGLSLASVGAVLFVGGLLVMALLMGSRR